jgi:hypothetical protein
MISLLVELLESILCLVDELVVAPLPNVRMDHMSFAIIMCLMGCINVPVESGERVGKKCEVQFASGIEIFEKFFQFAPNVFVRLFDTVEYHIKHTKETAVEQLCDGRNRPAPQEGKTPHVGGRHQTGNQQQALTSSP